MAHTAPHFAQRLEAAHAALFQRIQRQGFSARRVAYAEAGISLDLRPGATASATLRPTYDASGRSAIGLEIVAPEERVAAYLLQDLIAAVKSGEMSKEITACSAVVDYMDGYPMVLGWH